MCVWVCLCLCECPGDWCDPVICWANGLWCGWFQNTNACSPSYWYRKAYGHLQQTRFSGTPPNYNPHSGEYFPTTPIFRQSPPQRMHKLAQAHAHTYPAYTARTHALGQNQCPNSFLCPRIVYIVVGHSCSSLMCLGDLTDLNVVLPNKQALFLTGSKTVEH